MAKKSVLGAALSSKNNTKEISGAFNKTIRNVPLSAKARFDKLKEAGEVSGTLSTYIVQGLLDKLAKDER